MSDKTPVTDSGLRKYDDLPPKYAVLRAWREPGRDAGWHEAQRRVLRRTMPLLARALDRLEAEGKTGPLS